MKRVFFIAVAIISLNATAQDRGRQINRGEHPMEMFKDLSAEEVATLQTKRMTLDLNLTESQQNDIYKIHLERTKQRKLRHQDREKKNDKGSRKELSNEERYELINKKLDERIAHKNEMRTILNTEQFEKWERSQKRKEVKSKLKKRRSRRSK